ncbi:MAG: TonB-dependent receptor domain-containing protein, partial [Propionibacterium acidifaciens]
MDLSYRPAEGWQLFASWNKSLRLPTFTDLYYKSPTQEGNLGLQAEEINAYR